MNKKGQVLIAFLLILPVIITLIALLYDIGLIGLTKKNMTDTLKTSIYYGLEHIDEEDVSEKIEYLLNKNIKNIFKREVEIKDRTIKISLIVDVDGNFKNLFKQNIYRIDLKYYGYIENETIKIKEWS